MVEMFPVGGWSYCYHEASDGDYYHRVLNDDRCLIPRAMDPRTMTYGS